MYRFVGEREQGVGVNDEVEEENKVQIISGFLYYVKLCSFDFVVNGRVV